MKVKNLFQGQLCQIPLEILSGMDSGLETEFAHRWEEKFSDFNCKLQHHFRCIPGTAFEADFTHHESGVIIEVNGGTWTKTRTGHSTGTGIARDYKKLILAAELGYLTVMLDCNMVRDDDCLDRIYNVIQLRQKTVTLPLIENKNRRIAKPEYPLIYTKKYVDGLTKV